MTGGPDAEREGKERKKRRGGGGLPDGLSSVRPRWASHAGEEKGKGLALCYFSEPETTRPLMKKKKKTRERKKAKIY